MSEIESALDNVETSSDDKEEMKYVVSLAKKRIDSWKAHLLRSINQDEARLDVLKDLDACSALVVFDWAMKYLPRKYRESQTDWFGKRGISWHITTAMRKSEGQLQMLSFVHIFQSCNQNSVTVLAIIDDALKQLKTTMPEVKRVHLRQDNAGCYHSASTLLAIQLVANKYNINVRMDFSDPQGGKGSCDRKAATIKNHMRLYLNSGQDVETADQMKNAIESSGGVPGVRAMLCDSQGITYTSSAPVKWDGVSFINNIEYGDEGIRVWRSYAVGPGKFLPWSQFNLPETYSLPELNTLKEANIPKAQFTAITSRRKSSLTQQGEKQMTVSLAEDSDEQSDDDKQSHDKLFSCPEEGCIKSFQRFSSLQRRLDVGRHSYVLENETLVDKAMMSYATKLEEGIATVDNPTEETGTLQSLDSRSPLAMGWALKSSGTKRTRLTENQKQHLTEVFQIGERTGHKADPRNMSKSVRKARNADGSRRFDASSFLTPQQIASFFSPCCKKSYCSWISGRRRTPRRDGKNARIKSIENLSNQVMAEMSIQHPIMYDMHNICEIASCSNLAKFSIQMLQDMCSFYQLDISSVNVKRKKPYIDLSSNLVASCSCKFAEE